MYRDALGVERDVKKAMAFFHAAAQQDHAEAQVNLGKYHFGTLPPSLSLSSLRLPFLHSAALGDFPTATSYFEHAIRVDDRRSPDQFQSYFYLAELAQRASAASAGGGGDACPVAVSFYKRVAERGDWDSEVWWEAERAREKGDERTALLGYWIMAERGYEVAQNNVAWLLDQSAFSSLPLLFPLSFLCIDARLLTTDKTRLRLPLLDSIAPSPSSASKSLDRLALAYWTRSAAQDNVDALVKMGDYYFAGTGTEDGLPQLEKAAGCYQSAATSRFSSLSMWNLGWMHETGQGVPQVRLSSPCLQSPEKS
jgi:SEL1 protein